MTRHDWLWLTCFKVLRYDEARPNTNDSPPWNHAVQQRIPTPESALETTSQVGDLGNGRYVEQQQQQRRRLSPSESWGTNDLTLSTNSLLEVGAEFRQDATPGRSLSTESTFEAEASQTANDGASLTKSVKFDLGRQIRKTKLKTANKEDKSFYPIDDLYRIVTSGRAKEALEELDNIARHEIDEAVGQILGTTTCLGKPTSRIKIFVILVLMDKLHAIVDFIAQNVFDIHLPLEETQDSDGNTRLNRNQQVGGPGSNIPIDIFDHWTDNEIDAFLGRQYEVCVPIFWLSTDEEPLAEVPHFELQSGIVLPFVKDDEGKQGTRSGGFGEVWKVQLHTAHHNHCKSMVGILARGLVSIGVADGGQVPVQNPSFAVKRLQRSDDKATEAFRREVSALNRFSAHDHPHLIKLLCTYHWHGDYYFLFPWADGNLKDLWQRSPWPLARQQQCSTAQWFSEQCLGLVKGLRDIHNGTTELSGPAAADPKRHLSSSRKTHGKHGDLTPQNILFFKNKNAREDDGPRSTHFKISDFGVAEFHRSISLQVAAKDAVVTPTYRAPECDTTKELSPNYDIWSLACILLECVAWYLGGWQEVNHFASERLNDEGSNYSLDPFCPIQVQVDKFFDLFSVIVKDHQGGAPTNVAMRKQAVTEASSNFSWSM